MRRGWRVRLHGGAGECSVHVDAVAALIVTVVRRVFTTPFRDLQHIVEQIECQIAGRATCEMVVDIDHVERADELTLSGDQIGLRN